MANVLPQSREQMIAWFSDRLTSWAANAASIGLSAPQVTALATMVNTAEGSLGSATAARISSKDATVAFHADADALRSYGADLIKVIKAFAESTDDPSVYSTASVPPPSPPTPAGPPDKPTELEASLVLPWGIRLAWKGSVSQSAYFGVFRRLPGESNFTFVQTVKEKRFDDTTLPAGTASVEYYIAAFRDSYQVNSNALAVQFGPAGMTSTTLSLAA